MGDLPPPWSMDSILKTGDVLRIDDAWRANFNEELLSLDGMVTD